MGLLYPDSGSINVLGRNIEELNTRELDELRTKVGFLFQSNALYDSMTVRENLEFPLRRHWIKVSAAETEKKVMEVRNELWDVTDGVKKPNSRKKRGEEIQLPKKRSGDKWVRGG